MAYKITPAINKQYLELLKNGIGYNIPYSKGTMVKINGEYVPASPKPKKLHDDILSKTIQNITVEGGQRAGKDVYSVHAMAKYYMMHPAKSHLVLANSKDLALQNFFDCDGFGIQYLLPHGRKSYISKTQDVFEFLDFYGELKQIFFFGAKNKNSKNSYQGMTVGSVYAMETSNLDVDSLVEGRQRSVASYWNKNVHTLNPVSPNDQYYLKYEKPLIATEEEIEKLKKSKSGKVKMYNSQLKELILDKQLLREKLLTELLKQNNMTSEEELKNKPDLYTTFNALYNIKCFDLEKEFVDKTRPNEIFFEEYNDNPNGIKNGVNFRYHHLTFYDNLSMTDYQREQAERNFDKTSMTYKRNILGIRCIQDGAIFTGYSKRNILYDLEDIPIDYRGYNRYISIDFGMKNDFVVLDCEVSNDYVVYVLNEERYCGKTDSENTATLGKYVKMIEKLLKSRLDGKYNCIIVDPSATVLINELLEKGYSVIKAKNDVSKSRGGRSSRPVHPSRSNIYDGLSMNEKDLVGIHLVNEGFSRLKIFISNENCLETIKEIESYAYDIKKLEVGIEAPSKVNDHGVDALRYVVNTVVKTIRNWND